MDGGSEGIRILDPQIKSLLLYRLSYGTIHGADYRN